MIIKFKSRKRIHSSKQACRYILTEDGKLKNPFAAPALFQNIKRLDIDTIHKDFLENHKFSKQRKNGIALCHEILAIHDKDTPHVTNDMLQDLMEKYIELRGLKDTAVLIAKAHIHEDHKHIHVLFGSNHYESVTTYRMTRKEMLKLLRDFESYQIEKYPQLTNSIVHLNKERPHQRDLAKEDRSRRKEAEFQMRTRMKGVKSNKDHASLIIGEIFIADSPRELERKIIEHSELQVYKYRSRLAGIVFKNRKYRWKTLGISQEQIQRLECIEIRLTELGKVKQFSKSRRRNRG